jgi:hypothetical protein
LFYRGDAKQTYQFNLAEELVSMEPGTCKIMDFEEICSGEVPEDEEVVSTDSVSEDSKNTTYAVIAIIAVILIVIALIIKKYRRK